MNNGISIYPGFGNTPEENLALIRLAASHKLNRLFISLPASSENKDSQKEEFLLLLQEAKQHRMEIIAELSPQMLEMLHITDFNLTAFRMLGIQTLRIDCGYSAEELAALSRNKQHIRIQINASTMTGRILSSLIQAKADFSNMDALHNFYPRSGSGLSEETLVRKTIMLHKAGIRVAAFVPSQAKKLGPLFDGLPTLEDHRQMCVDLAARHLVALGIDSVLIGDNLPSEDEILALSHLQEDQVTVNADMLTKDPVQQALLRHVFTSRIDEAKDSIRAQESRKLLSGPIYPENTVDCLEGDITIDNENYLRYMGELEILKTDQPADDRTNLAARIPKKEHFLLAYITPGRKFSFRFQDRS